ncbi:MAG: hypothetical protein HY913_19245 [Desulfomonile tiedjei]|nr:hypothetical protein [Desulfomonile tiedjei]
MSSRIFMSVLQWATAVFLCLILSAAPASAADTTFQERYNLPQAPETLLEEILSRPEFKEDATLSFIEDLWQRLSDELARLMARILKRLPLSASPKIDEHTGWLIMKMLLLGSAALLVIYILVLVFGLFARRRALLNTSVIGPESGEAGVSGSRDAWDEATRLGEKGDYSEALINLFRFALLKLNEQGILLFYRGKTNREILESISNDKLRELVREMIPSFNQVRYGNGSCDRSEYEHVRSLCLRLPEGT